MAGFKAAKRYAKGLMQFANESSQSQQINDEMKDLKNAIQSSKELAQFLGSPVLDARRKVQITKEIFKDFSPVTQNFIQLVINHGRGDILKEIATQYNYLYDKQNRVNTIEVTSATELDATTVDEIVEKAKQNFGEGFTYHIENKINPDLIGGFILRVGDKQIDNSIKSKLTRLKKEFEKNDYVPKF